MPLCELHRASGFIWFLAFRSLFRCRPFFATAVQICNAQSISNQPNISLHPGCPAKSFDILEADRLLDSLRVPMSSRSTSSHPPPFDAQSHCSGTSTIQKNLKHAVDLTQGAQIERRLQNWRQFSACGPTSHRVARDGCPLDTRCSPAIPLHLNASDSVKQLVFLIQFCFRLDFGLRSRSCMHSTRTQSDFLSQRRKLFTAAVTALRKTPPHRIRT
ncbi:hypothetical protein DFH06DRAFT_426449 [Mycena polygramma]|nr:hypothetical protein DFH06DRAFT_426449 [Mycena polygramma]